MEINIWTNLFILFVVYNLRIYITLFFNRGMLDEHRATRRRLRELRNLPVRTREEQFEFITLKTPMKEPFRWSFMNVLKKLPLIVLMVGVFIGLRYLWKLFVPFVFTWWQVLLVFVFVPILVNNVLRKYDLHQDDIRVYFGGGKK